VTNTPPEPGSYSDTIGLKSLKCGDLYVIVKDVSEKGCSPGNVKAYLSDKQGVEINLSEHTEVINNMMKIGEVIPFSFGIIFHSETSLEKFITNNSATLKQNFHAFGGREEWSIKVFCNRKSLSAQIDELSEEAAAMEREIMDSSPGKAFLLKRKKTDLVENEMDRICKNYGQTFFNELNILCDSSVLNNLLPKEFTDREDTMILNASFLVNRNNVNDFTKILGTLEKKECNACIKLEISGPLPPFSFFTVDTKNR